MCDGTERMTIAFPKELSEAQWLHALSGFTVSGNDGQPYQLVGGEFVLYVPPPVDLTT